MFIQDNMRKIVAISILIPTLIFMASCHDREFNMRVCSGKDFTYTETWIKCDSFQMISQTEAFIWVDGKKMRILGDRGIKPETN